MKRFTSGGEGVDGIPQTRVVSEEVGSTSFLARAELQPSGHGLDSSNQPTTAKPSKQPYETYCQPQMLDTLLDRNHLEASSEPPFPGSGVGYEVVQVMESGASLLKDINK